MTSYYFVYYVHDDYAGDSTLWRCLKDFETVEEAYTWGANMRIKVLAVSVKRWEHLPLGFDQDDLNSIEMTIQPHTDWMNQLQAKAVELEAFMPEKEDDDEDDEDDDPDKG